MKRNDPKYGNNLAFIDFLFNYLLAFAFLFIIAFMMIRPPTQTEANTKLKAEIVLNMTWPDASLDDIDMWLLLPNGQKVWFMHKEEEYATLDRDDRGGHGDTFRKNPADPQSEKGLIRVNKETIVIRALVPGRYVVAGHVFATYADVDGFKNENALPFEVKLEAIKLNPRATTFSNSTIVLEKQAQQKAFLAFTVKEDGSVEDIEQNPDDVIVPSGASK